MSVDLVHTVAFRRAQDTDLCAMSVVVHAWFWLAKVWLKTEFRTIK